MDDIKGKFNIQEKKLSQAEVNQKLVEEEKKQRAATMGDLQRVDFKIKRKNSRYDIDDALFPVIVFWILPLTTSTSKQPFEFQFLLQSVPNNPGKFHNLTDWLTVACAWDITASKKYQEFWTISFCKKTYILDTWNIKSLTKIPKRHKFNFEDYVVAREHKKQVLPY